MQGELEEWERTLLTLQGQPAHKKSQHDLLSGSFCDIAAALRLLGKVADAMAW